MSRKHKRKLASNGSNGSVQPAPRPIDLLRRSADPFETFDSTRCIGGPAPAPGNTAPLSPNSAPNASPHTTRSPAAAPGASHPLAQLLQKFAFKFPYETQPDFFKSQPGSPGEKPADGPMYPTDPRTDADLTMRMAFEQGITAWADESGINYVTLPLEGRFTDVLLTSVSVRSWLARLNFTHSARLLSQSATNQCLLVLQGDALFHPPRPHTEETAMCAITSDAVGVSLLAHVSASGRFEGPLVELDRLLKSQADLLRRHFPVPRGPERAYPLSLSHLSARLRKLDSALRTIGLHVSFTRRAAGTWCVVEPGSNFETAAPPPQSIPQAQFADPPVAESAPSDPNAGSTHECLHSLTDHPQTTCADGAGNVGNFRPHSAGNRSLHHFHPETTHTASHAPSSLVT